MKQKLTQKDIYLHKVAESLLYSMQQARDEAKKLPESERKHRILRRLEILDAIENAKGEL